MANTIKLKRGSGSDPSASDLAVGEVALRTDNAKLFTKNDAGNVAQIGGGLADVVDDTTPQLGGDLQSNGSDIDFADGDKAIFGGGNDLQIYHSGSHSFIQEEGTGSLYIDANQFYLRQASDDTILLQTISNGEVRINHNGNEKIKTQSGGIDVTGDITVSGTVDGVDIASLNSTVSGKLSNVVEDTSPQLGGNLDTNGNNIVFGDSGGTSDDRLVFGASSDLQIYHHGGNGNSAIVNSSGDLFITNNGDDLFLQALDDVIIKTQGGEVSIQCFGNGGVELYCDTIKRFETSGDGATLTGNLTVSGTVDGRDVATDGTKLDGIESNATADQTAGEIKTLLQSDKITASEIANDTITAVQLANNSANVNVIVDGAVTTAKIANNAVTADKLPNSEVTFAKITDIPQNRIVGRISSGSGVIQELTAANVRSIINVADGATNVTNTNQLTNGAGFITSADGGNAQQLDGIDSSQFLRSDANDSASGLISLSAGIAFNNTSRCTASVTALSDGSTITVDFTAGIHHSVTLGGNRTFGNPSNDASAVGQSGSIFITQDGTGSRTASFHGDYKFAGGTAPTLSTAANAVDRLDYVIKSSGVIHCVVTLDVN